MKVAPFFPTWIENGYSRRKVNFTTVRQLLDYYVTKTARIPKGKYERPPSIQKILLSDIMAKHNNSEAKQFIRWINNAKIPPMSELDKFAKDASDSFRLVHTLSKYKISSDMIIYKAAKGNSDAITLFTKFPDYFLEYGTQGNNEHETILFIIKNYNIKLLRDLLINKKSVNILSRNQCFGKLRYAGNKRLEAILLTDNPELLKNLEQRGNGAYYYLALGLESKAVTEKIIEQSRRLELSEDGKIALVHLTGRPVMEFRKQE